MDSKVSQQMILYKYVTPDRIDILERGLIRFTQPLCFNDPFEVFPAVESFLKPGRETELKSLVLTYMDSNPEELERFCLEELTKYQNLHPFNIKTKSTTELVIREMRRNITPFLHSLITQLNIEAKTTIINHIREKMNTTMGILSLSEIPDSLLMWAHYTDCHHGFVLEFNGAHPFFDQRKNMDDLIRHVCKVKYSYDRPKVSFLDPRADPKSFFTDLFVNFCLTKSQDWEYEQEWRMILPLTDVNCIINHAGGNIYLFSLPLESIQAVILGSMMNNYDKNRIRSNIMKNDQCKHIHLKQALIDPNHFRINIVGEEL